MISGIVEFRTKNAAKISQLFIAGCFIEGNPDGMFVELPQIHSGLGGAGQNRLRVFIGEIDAQGIEEVLVSNLQPGRLQRLSKLSCQAMDAFRDRAQTARAMVNRIHRRDHGEKDLGRANVARRFVAPDVLFAGLEREPVPGRPVASCETPTNRPAMWRL